MRLVKAIFLLLVLGFTACKAPEPLRNYVQHASDSTIPKTVVLPELKIQPQDLLSIQISSTSLQPEKSDAMFNQVTVSSSGSGTSTANGYLVNNQGNIQHHRLGTIHAAGLTRAQLEAEIKKILTNPVELLSDPTVSVRFQNFRVNVLGQVAQQGPVTVPGDRLTILEAIALAGGVTDYGKKENVKIIREIDGKRELATLDLTSDKVYNSPYFLLAQNDVLVVDYNGRRQREEDNARNFQRLSIAFSLITIAATLVNIIDRL